MSEKYHLPHGWTCDQCERGGAHCLYVCSICKSYHCIGCNNSEALCKRCAAKRAPARVPGRPEPVYARQSDDRRLGADVAERNWERGY